VSLRRLSDVWLGLLLLGLVAGFFIGAATWTCPDDAGECDLGTAYAVLGALVGAGVGLLVAAVLTVVVKTQSRRARRARVEPPSA
jgi:membrane associated rhomboid family serine protease